MPTKINLFGGKNVKKIRKKGDPTDIFLFLVIIFFVAVSFVVVIFTNTKVHEIISTTALNESDAFASIDASFY